MMARLATLLLVLSVSGCASVHSIYPGETGEIEVLHDRLIGRIGTVELVDATRATGTILFVREDSTAWQASGVRQAAPTVGVARIERHRQAQHVWDGLRIGSGVAGIAVVMALTTDDSAIGGPTRGAMGASALGAIGLGVGLGTIQSRPRVYVLRR